MDIIQNINDIAKSKGLTLTEIERMCGFSKSSMRKWSENIPSMEKIIKVADTLNVGLDYIVYGTNRDERLNDDEQELLSNYRKSSRIDKARIQERALVSAEHAAESNEESHITTIKLFDSAVSAGTGIYVDYTDYENIETREDTEGADYAVKVSGNSMEPRFYDSDIVLVEIAQTVEVGEIGIFNLNGQAFIKERGEKALISLNKDYDPIVVNPGDSIACQGRVIKVLSTKVGA